MTMKAGKNLCGVAFPRLRVADAAVMRPGWLWNDAFLAEGH